MRADGERHRFSSTGAYTNNTCSAAKATHRQSSQPIHLAMSICTKAKMVCTQPQDHVHQLTCPEFVHFCWRPRDCSLDQSELDLIMIPGDGSFQPYTGKDAVDDSENIKSPTDGRIFVLKFSSSSQRYLFWLQSKSQHPRGASWFSERDLKIGQVIDLLLTGEEIDVHAELAGISNSSGNDEDETMEDVEPSSRNRHGSTGGAGAGATGGDIRDEGEESREGGADGGRA